MPGIVPAWPVHRRDPYALRRHLAGRVRRLRTQLVEFDGERDDVHLLVHYPPKVAISRLVGSLKGAQPAGSAKSSPATTASTCGVTVSAPCPNSPRPEAVHRWRSSRSASRTRSVPAEATNADSCIRAGHLDLEKRFLLGFNAQDFSPDHAEHNLTAKWRPRPWHARSRQHEPMHTLPPRIADFRPALVPPTEEDRFDPADRCTPHR
ncbi:transposase [Streptomyces sp. NPDC005227]|uniref:transposase n=1 Tax=Streptomyces sp. NPDC005227 TaxID=3364707 RepID=UPI003683E0C1